MKKTFFFLFLFFSLLFDTATMLLVFLISWGVQ